MKWILYILKIRYWVMFQEMDNITHYYVGKSTWSPDLKEAIRFKTDPSVDYEFFAYWHRSKLINRSSVLTE